MKNLLTAETFPEFSKQAFWCRWNLAIVNSLALFITAIGFVKGGRSIGMLLGPPNTAADTATVLIATTLVVAIGYLEKQKATALNVCCSRHGPHLIA